MQMLNKLFECEQIFCISFWFLKLGKLDGLEDSLNTFLESLNLKCLDSLMIKNVVIMKSGPVLSNNHASFEQSLTTIAGLDKLVSDLSSISAIDNDSLVWDVIGEDGVGSAVEHESVIIELLHTSHCGKVGARLIIELCYEGRGYGLEGEGVAVLELDRRVGLIDGLLNTDVLL